ncbi:MAG: hypothetical protein S4CHLAM81_06870 [Chlamydiales bacterium]|nr:hypothetical protein [Chlamydiales bacterium]MCH9635471.1 hypothetical protein [Chlamydiales bacterium]
MSAASKNYQSQNSRMRAIITGGSSGIGKAFATLLQSKKYEVIALGSKDAKLPHQTERIIDLIHQKKPDLLVNCAGFGLYGKVHELSITEQMEMVEVNCQALMELSWEMANSLLKEGRSGTIFNISSLASHFPSPGMASYGATKAFVTSFSEAMDFELKGSGVRVLVSCPGMVESRFATRAAKKRVKISGQMSPTYVANRMWRQLKRGIGRDSFPNFSFCPKSLAKWLIYRSIQKRL